MLVSPLHLRGDFIAAPFPPGRHARHPRLAGIAHALCRQCVDRRRADGPSRNGRNRRSGLRRRERNKFGAPFGGGLTPGQKGRDSAIVRPIVPAKSGAASLPT